MMNVNDDFSQRVVVHAEQLPWEESPMPGVRRRRLDRVIGEMDRVSSIVEYAEKSVFSSHEHTGGEELLVLDGVFEDDYGAWPAGSYLRNPPGSTHSPHSETGCTVLEKQCQFDANDNTFVHAHIHKLAYIEPNNRVGVSVASLYKNEHEAVSIERWNPGACVEFTAVGGAEIFLIEGAVKESEDQLEAQSWIRTPVGGKVCAIAGPRGALVWVKTNHLKHL